ncbi:50S ribosomal protein L5 [Roseiconus lacunae]|uniref:Large ribosomal subunit protein uL5 n=1 Tax=Roseiconus lacunae TaxID=2605694 RepID=A0ABT7PS04_9BACT|nr:50S ribosomal protein L5 [Roseiconus lacunae]MCD0460269.1 50S ribosomal protein L5 [Roseiconus lacunae]MDM4019282.1 50S ribosomal protein L5 [Roseiconus lacunae]WRQ51905.1 50S ribosomal protein L5 [Stieleria sp. HD01]
MSDKPRLQAAYEDTIRGKLTEQFGYSNPHQVPRMEKITLNMGVGQAIGDKKILDFAVDAMTQISGQKPVITTARKSIAGFKLREGMPIGCMVTMRRQRMYEFMDRLVAIVLPRVRDFRGISRKAFDGNGNYTLGLTEQLVFPELNPDKFTRPQGMNLTFVTSAKTNDEARTLLEMMGMPFKAAPGKKQDAA